MYIGDLSKYVAAKTLAEKKAALMEQLTDKTRTGEGTAAEERYLKRKALKSEVPRERPGASKRLLKRFQRWKVPRVRVPRKVSGDYSDAAMQRLSNLATAKAATKSGRLSMVPAVQRGKKVVGAAGSVVKVPKDLSARAMAKKLGVAREKLPIPRKAGKPIRRPPKVLTPYGIKTGRIRTPRAIAPVSVSDPGTWPKPKPSMKAVLVLPGLPRGDRLPPSIRLAARQIAMSWPEPAKAFKVALDTILSTGMPVGVMVKTGGKWMRIVLSASD
jgi:hypothetical protein